MRARKSWRLHVPSTRQCRGQPAPCQGNPIRKPANIRLFRKARCCGARAWPSLAPRRRAFDRQPVAAERNQGSGQRPAQPGMSLPQRVIKRFELGELDRALVAGMGDGAAEEPQRHFGGQARELARSANTIGPRCGHGPGASAARAAATANSMVEFGAPHPRRPSRARPRASSPSRASAGISVRSRARVKRGSRLLGSSL